MAPTAEANKPSARRGPPRRAFSLFEMLAAVAVMGLIASVAVMRFGQAAYQTTDAEGFAYRLALDLNRARRATITTGVDHHLQLNRTGGLVTGYTLMQGASAVDQQVLAPDGATFTTPSDAWLFDFDGSLQTPATTGAIRIDNPQAYWEVTVYQATGQVRVVKAYK